MARSDKLTANAAGASGLVRVSYGNQGIVELADGQCVDAVFRRSVGRPFCGDRVSVEPVDEHSWAVTAIATRRNEFARVDRHGRKQIIASNLDRVAIVIAPRPAPSTDLVERYLVAVHSLASEPVLVINKVELLHQGAGVAEHPFDRLEEYRALGYRVVTTSCKGDPGIDELLPLLHEHTAILVGQSGVGKSSLANRLIPDLDLQTGELSRATGKGTHTTTTTIMYRMRGGGRLIDSPGVWEYGLWTMSADELADGFPEFSAYVGTCRFNDCQHASEPGCAITAAVGEGHILPWRYAAYRRLLLQNAT